MRSAVGSVRWNTALLTSGYFKSRGLQRYAGLWSLWALGVGAVISGDFFGWNFGLAVGGFGGLAIATVVVAVMYLGLCYSIAEMSPAMPHSGGAYSFARTAMGPWGGFITGLAECIEYIFTPAVIVVGIGGYMGTIINDMLGIELPGAGLVVDILRALRWNKCCRSVAHVSDIHGAHVYGAGHLARLLGWGNSAL